MFVFPPYAAFYILSLLFIDGLSRLLNLLVSAQSDILGAFDLIMNFDYWKLCLFSYG